MRIAASGAVVVAHAGGIDEVLIFVGAPLVVYLLFRRLGARDSGTDAPPPEDEEAQGPPSGDRAAEERER